MPEAPSAPARLPFSFELYPPRSPTAATALPGVVGRLAAAGPEFLSVTYGAGGSSRAASLDLVRHVLTATDVEPMAHLTCIGASHEETSGLVRRFLDAGVHRFLAIRGDPPAGADEIPLGGVQTSAELVQLIHRVQAERVHDEERPLPAGPGSPARRASVAVAAFVNPRASSGDAAREVDALLAKQEAGADLALTQLFFHAEDYAAFLERARAAGVTLPIVPGIMPVTSPARLKRMLELSGEDEPADLALRLELEPTAAGQAEVGVGHAADLARALIDAGAPALHLYSFNRADAVLAVLERLGLLPPADHDRGSSEPVAAASAAPMSAVSGSAVSRREPS